MKLSIFLLVLISISYVKTEYNLVAFGDIGQIDIYAKRNPGKVYKKAIKNKESTDSAAKKVQDLLTAEKYDIKGNQCSLKINGKFVDPVKETYNNFKSILCASSKYIEKSDQVTVLGDIVYAEFKGLPVKDGNLVNKVVQSQMENRTICGFSWFRDLLKNIRKYCPRVKPSIQKKLWSKKANRLHHRFYIIQGNHSFDVNYKIGSRMVTNMSIAKAFYIGSKKQKERNIKINDLNQYPRFKSVRKNGLKIEFVDLNTLILSSVLDGQKGVIRSEEEYKSFCTKALNIAKILPYKKAVAYVGYTFKAIEKFTSSSHWRVIRSHHPPMNLDGSFTEQDYMWKVKYEGRTLFQLMKNKKVKVYIASHHHSGHVTAFPYKKFRALTEDKFDDKVIKLSKTGNCLYHDPKALEENRKKPTAMKNICPKEALNYHIHDNFESNNGGYLWTFVAGNGGRELDKMNGSNLTRAALIWGRAVPNLYGAMNLRFSKKKLTVTFYEVNQNKHQDVAHFNLFNVKKPDSYHLINQEIKTKLKSNARIVKKAMIVK